MRQWLPVIAASLLSLASSFTFAQDNVVAGYKTDKPPVIDGTIDASEWAGFPSGQGAYDDETGGRAPENMQFWLGYDANYVYFAAKAFDSDPSSISATEYRTNVSLSGDDHINLLLDLGGSLADFNEFGMNAKGATLIELAGGRAAKREWSGEFVSKGRITAEGWEVEARIPWRIMRLPGAGPRTLRFNVERALRRTQRDFVWQYTGEGQRERYGRWTDVDLPRAPFERSLKLLPYAYGGFDRSEHIANAGLDVKTNLADQIALVGSINPDFRNIENAILSLDFSRFERLAGETRPFFQEGSDYLNSALFASQRITKFDAGLNMYGKLNDKLSFGVLDAIDFGERNSTVANFSYDPTADDSLRVTTTSLAQSGRNNEASLVRYNRILGPWSIFARNMATKDTLVGSGVSNSLYAQYSKEGLGGFLGWDSISPNFQPRLGFVPERNFRGYITGLSLNRPLATGPIREFYVESFYTNYDRYHGGHYREGFDTAGNLVLRSGLSIGGTLHIEDFEGVDDRLYGLSLRYPRGNPYRNIGLTLQTGRLEMEDYHTIGVNSAYRLNDKLQVNGSYQHVDHFERSDLAVVGMNYDLGRDMYVSGRTVKRGKDWNAYLSFRRSGNRGAEYYLILGDPNAARFRSSLVLKVVWPFEVN